MPDIEAFVDGSTTIKPRYQVGDILWVRETWRVCPSGIYCYKATGDCDTCSTTGENTFNVKWRPSIFMPREAARLFLRVTNVRVERLQEIDSHEAWNDGARCRCMHPVPECAGNIETFKDIWFSTLPKYYYDWMSWQGNPWVWVYEFERVSEDEI